MSNSKHHTFKAHGDLQLAEYVRSVYHLWVPPGVTIEQATDVRSFVHIANKLKINDEIIIRAEDDAFYARAIVRFVKNHDVSVTLLEKIELKTPQKLEDDSEYEVKYINGRYKWGFKMKGSDNWIANEIPTEEEAMVAVRDHRKAMAA